MNGITNPTFTYDANGNILTSLGRSFTWTSYNMVSQVTQGTTTLGFTYNPDHQRLKQCIGGCTSPTTTTLYLNDPISGSGSEKSTTGTSVVWRDYIVADGQIVASHINNIDVNSMQYFVRDALGSTAALTDTSGNTLERDYYDPWGKRRNANGSADTSCALTSATTRGFSGHEMMDSVCMTNMNARLYDQYLSRFASADTMVSDPGNGQDYNRYSYVNNRPTAYRDPTGHGTVGKTPSPGEPEDGLGSDDSSGSSDSSAGSDDSSSGDQGDDSDSGTETIVITGDRIPPQKLFFDNTNTHLNAVLNRDVNNGWGEKFAANDPKKPHCYKRTLMGANILKSLTHLANTSLTTFFATGVVLVARGIPYSTRTDGMSLAPGTLMMAGSIVGFRIVGNVSDWAQIGQSAASGDPGPMDEVTQQKAEQQQLADQAYEYGGQGAAEAVDYTMDTYNGLKDGVGPPPVPVECAAG